MCTQMAMGLKVLDPNVRLLSRPVIELMSPMELYWRLALQIKDCTNGSLTEWRMSDVDCCYTFCLYGATWLSVSYTFVLLGVERVVATVYYASYERMRSKNAVFFLALLPVCVLVCVNTIPAQYYLFFLVGWWRICGVEQFV